MHLPSEASDPCDECDENAECDKDAEKPEEVCTCKDGYTGDGKTCTGDLNKNNFSK